MLSVDRIVAEWKFDEGSGNNVADATGNGNDGTWSGSADHWAVNDIPQLGGAGKFNGGISDVVQIPGPDFLKNPTENLAIEVWIKPNRIDIAQDIFSKNITGSTGPQFLLWHLNGGLIFGLFWDGGGSGYVSAPGVIKAGEWHHVAATYHSIGAYEYFGSLKLNSFSWVEQSQRRDKGCD